MKASSQWLRNLTWEDIKEQIKVAKGTVILPVGSTEQHGPHLPVGTDTMVAPPLWFGWSPHHMVLPGTITIRPEILIEITSDIIGSLNQHGFDKFIFVNGHRIVNVTWMQITG